MGDVIYYFVQQQWCQIFPLQASEKNQGKDVSFFASTWLVRNVHMCPLTLFIVWLVSRAGKIKRILRSDCIPEGAR